jgi:malate synthase
LQQNVAVGIGYLEAWLRGIGCVPLFNLMEDAATAEISRAQLWQWVHHHAVLQDDEHKGQAVTAELCDEVIDTELARASEAVPPARFHAYEHAAFLMRELIKTPKFQDFLTLPAYARVLDTEIYTA